MEVEDYVGRINPGLIKRDFWSYWNIEIGDETEY